MVRAALIGTGVALLCILPPIIHFLTGPLSPAIGGFVGGMQFSGRDNVFGTVVGMAALMTAILTVTITIIAGIGLAIAANLDYFEATFRGDILLLVALFASIYIFGMSVIGGLIGSSLRK